jgi:hypothetical protein
VLKHPWKKAPGRNRIVPIINRVTEGLNGADAAWRVARALTKSPIEKPRRLRTVPAVLKTMEDGTPVVLTAKLPNVLMSDGYLVASGNDQIHTMTVVLVTYRSKRQAVRITPCWASGGARAGARGCRSNYSAMRSPPTAARGLAIARLETWLNVGRILLPFPIPVSFARI